MTYEVREDEPPGFYRPVIRQVIRRLAFERLEQSFTKNCRWAYSGLIGDTAELGGLQPDYGFGWFPRVGGCMKHLFTIYLQLLGKARPVPTRVLKEQRSVDNVGTDRLPK
jgi:hypothetical protein